MKIVKEISVEDFEGWSGANDTIEVIEKAGKVDEFDNLIEELYPDGLSETSLNDLLRFDYEWIYETLDITKSYKVSVYNIEYDVDDDDEIDQTKLPTHLTIELEEVGLTEEDLKDAIVNAIEEETEATVADYEYKVLEEDYD